MKFYRILQDSIGFYRMEQFWNSLGAVWEQFWSIFLWKSTGFYNLPKLTPAHRIPFTNF